MKRKLKEIKKWHFSFNIYDVLKYSNRAIYLLHLLLNYKVQKEET